LFANLSVANVVTDVQNCIGSVVAGGAVPFVADIKAALQSATDAKDGTAMACLGPALAIATAAKPASADGSTPAVYPGPVLIFQKYREFVTARRPVELQDRRAVAHQRHCGERAVMVRITEMQEQDIRRFVGEVLAEQTRLHINETDEVIFKAIATILTSFGIDKEDRRELRADFQHLRRWRKSVEQAQSYTLSSPGWSGRCGSASRSCSANDRRPRCDYGPSVLVSRPRGSLLGRKESCRSIR
jgi:hypothetical protein